MSGGNKDIDEIAYVAALVILCVAVGIYLFVKGAG